MRSVEGSQDSETGKDGTERDWCQHLLLYVKLIPQLAICPKFET